jgi:saccharopine dehydrogenase-like NADP-dependent oxidoreductase
LPANAEGKDLKQKTAFVCNIDSNSEAMKKIEWTGIFEDVKINLKQASPAQVLQKLLESKWVLKETDKDMIVMQHQFEYREAGSAIETKKLVSSLVVKGDNAEYTAMAKTVGLPMGIAAQLIMNGKINLIGVHIPVMKEIYEPVLKELKSFGIVFNEKHN